MFNATEILDANHDLYLTVTDVNELFDPSGNVIPLVGITPALRLPDGHEIHELSGNMVSGLTHGIAPGDVLCLDSCTDHELNVRVLQLADNLRTRRVTTTHCPICGEPLVPSEVGVGRCINLACAAQVDVKLRALFTALGLNLTVPGHPVLDALLTRGVITNVLDVFKLPPVVPTFDDRICTEANVNLLQAYIHSVRGNVDVHHLLDALQVPGWTPDTTMQIERFFHSQQWCLKDIPHLFDPAVQSTPELSNIDWRGWREMTSRKLNCYVITELGMILYR